MWSCTLDSASKKQNKELHTYKILHILCVVERLLRAVMIAERTLSPSNAWMCSGDALVRPTIHRKAEYADLAKRPVRLKPRSCYDGSDRETYFNCRSRVLRRVLQQRTIGYQANLSPPCTVDHDRDMVWEMKEATSLAHVASLQRSRTTPSVYPKTDVAVAL